MPLQPDRWKCTQQVPSELRSIGQHLKARRLALHLFQTAVAKQIEVEKTSIQNWERGISKPLPRFIPAIIKFLGYVPFSHDGTLGSRLRYIRQCVGWSQEELAPECGCHADTLG